MKEAYRVRFISTLGGGSEFSLFNALENYTSRGCGSVHVRFPEY